MRAILGAILFTLLIFLGVEYGFRTTGGIPSIIPGKTPFEFQWKIQNARAEKIVYVVGDSRVDWGFGDRLFTKVIKGMQPDDIQGFNAGLSAGSTRRIVEFILENHKGEESGVLLLNFSPAGFYHFNTSPGKALGEIKFQDFIDHRISLYLSELFYSYGRGWKNLYHHFHQYSRNGYMLQFGWFSREFFPDGFVNAKGGYNDGSTYVPDIGYYTDLLHRFSQKMDFYVGQKEKLIQVLREAISLGWDVILIRLPIGKEMRSIEQRLPREFNPKEIARRLDIFFIDYDSDPRTAELPTDESHLTPDSARSISRILAQDMVYYLLPDFEHEGPAKKIDPGRLKEEITIRRASVGDKIGIFDIHSLSIEKLKETPFYKEDLIDTWLDSISINSYDSVLFTHEMIVAEIDDVIVGFGQIDLKKGMIDSLHVSTPVLGDEVRRKILDGLEKRAIEQKTEALVLFTTLDSVPFYEKNGYRIKELKSYRFPNTLELKYAMLTKTLF
ncbi:MAG: GNAT family N-acetyltransferase [Thermodesulfobacteriota bacterium]